MAIDRKYGVVWLARAMDLGGDPTRLPPLASIDLRVEVPGVDTLSAEDMLRLEDGLRKLFDRVTQDAKAGLL